MQVRITGNQNISTAEQWQYSCVLLQLNWKDFIYDFIPLFLPPKLETFLGA